MNEAYGMLTDVSCPATSADVIVPKVYARNLSPEKLLNKTSSDYRVILSDASVNKLLQAIIIGSQSIVVYVI